MQTNVALNQVQEVASVLELNWGEPLSRETAGGLDLVLAADCVYFEPAFPLLVKTLRDLQDANPDAEFLFCYKKRRKADKRFFSLLKKHFEWQEVEDDPNRAIYAKDSIILLRLTRKKSDIKATITT
ncbi:hypothetical protein FRB99_004469 [Tulasnella sp. 403]|nr:hypothetical protein FRB99_004469 [Tulasnella sp. 403]